MSIKFDHFREEVVYHTLWVLAPDIPYSEHTVDLLMLTCAAESQGGTYLKQLQGPALGVYQMEPTTATDIHAHWLENRKELKHKAVLLGMSHIPITQQLTANLYLATAFARFHYRRSPMPIGTTIEEHAHMWKKVYNTPLGKGTVEHAIESYEKWRD